MKEDLKYIKENYGKNMMELCKKLFSELLKFEKLLPKLLDSNFAHSKLLCEDIIKYKQEQQFRAYIYGLLHETIKELTPEELLQEVGYTLFKCDSYEKFKQFNKCYLNETPFPYSDEKYTFFAIRNDVHEVDKAAYKLRQREDSYGRSILYITFTKGKVNNLEIISRYGMKVNNYNFTYYNNLENIIPGLTKSFEYEYGLKINQNGIGTFELPGYIKANDGKYYKYNYKLGNKYYGPNNIIIDNYNVITKYQDKKRYIIIDDYIIDLQEKKAITYKKFEDGFTDSISKVEDIIIEQKGKNRIIKINCKGNYIEIEIDKANRIIGYKNQKIKKITANFMEINKTLKILELPNVEEIGDYCLRKNEELEILYAPKLKKIGNEFLKINNKIKTLTLPNLLYFGPNFLYFNTVLKTIQAPNKEAIENRPQFKDILEKINKTR